MFRTSIAAIAMLVSSASANINTDFSAYLSGEQKVYQDDFISIWEQFKIQYGSISPNSHLTDTERRDIFAKNLDAIIQHNSMEGVSYTKGINQYSDMTEDDFRRHFNIQAAGADQDCSATDTRQSINKQFTEGDVPDAWDWREKGDVSPVKNQGHCGSCWTFSTVGTLEAHSLIKYSTFDSLAEQQLVDCAGAFDNNGCNGGLPSHAFEYISYAGGISTESAYPYMAVDQNCTVDPSTFALKVEGGSVNITEGDEDEMKEALYTHGPVSIAFEVVDGFRDYTSGVYTSTVCKNSPSDVNHAVVAVGYGTENGLDYWIVKNSWGADWGDQGFFKIQRGVNMCGVAECNSFPSEVVKVSAEQAFL